MASDADDLQPTVAPEATRAAALRDVEKSHRGPTGPTLALAGVSLDVAAGQLVVVHGRSGAGVSTLMRIVACLDRADSARCGWRARTLARPAGRRAESCAGARSGS